MKSFSIISIFSYIALDMYNDYSFFTDIYGSNFVSHFDTHSMGMLFGKFSNFSLKFVIAYLLS